MTDRPRFYLTTAIAYANNKPGLHTLYEVIGADVIARWHRMKGDDTRFLTGTDEPQWLTEKNWFFRLSAYQERLERWFLDNPGAVQPDYRRNEMLGFIRGGLEDFSISRAGATGGGRVPLRAGGR